ncbi:MAG TPA: ABC transporter ATP-binding protein [Casimicrobiaceae bacterium]|nr:ABC transporter ATP-binding protein [Casimicrobiaceae bacterium]
MDPPSVLRPKPGAPPSSDNAARAEPARRPPGIRFEGVTVAYGHTVALDDLNLAVEPGEVMALLGPSGSGKTTALRAVAGFVTPTRGRIFLGEVDVTHQPPYRRGIGMVVQQYALFPHMRVDQNVAFGLRAGSVPRAEIGPRVEESLRLVGMASYARRYPQELSGGQQQRVAIARALAIRPKVLLLDEPLSALDAQLRSGMLKEIARLHRELPDVTILYVTHDQIEALTLADRIAVMNDSRLVDVGSAQSLYQRPPSRFTATFVGNANLIPVTVQRCDQAQQQAWVRLGSRMLEVTAFTEAAPGDTRMLCIRPHALSLEPHASAANTIDATVTEVQWRGSAHRLYLDVDGAEMCADCRPLRAPPQRGERVSLHFASHEATLLAATAAPTAAAAGEAL